MDKGGGHTAVRCNALHTGKGPIVHSSAHRQQEAFLQLFLPFFNEKEKEDLHWGVQAILCLSLWQKSGMKTLISNSSRCPGQFLSRFSSSS